jgi:Arc/MetJ family transcription regulator
VKRELPARLTNAIRMRAIDNDLYPPAGNDAVRHLVKADGEGYDLEHPSFTEWWKLANAWVKEQRRYQKQAARLRADLAKRFPPPSHEQIISSSMPRFPEYAFTDWNETLLHDWAEALPDAIVKAESWLTTHA